MDELDRFIFNKLIGVDKGNNTLFDEAKDRIYHDLEQQARSQIKNWVQNNRYLNWEKIKYRINVEIELQ